jgi:hypothetical protein
VIAVTTGTLCEEHMTMERGAIMPDVDEYLPESEDHGRRGVWLITDQNGKAHQIAGHFLGMGSSYRPEHKGHPGAEWAPRGTHCSTCRWTEIRIFRDDAGTLYTVNCGASEVPGERDLIRVNRVGTPFELVESLTTVDRVTRQPVLNFPARHALAQAASHDLGVRDAYVNSPVTR